MSKIEPIFEISNIWSPSPFVMAIKRRIGDFLKVITNMFREIKIQGHYEEEKIQKSKN